MRGEMKFLHEINSPADLRRLRPEQLQEVADEIRQYILETMARIGGHTGASLGAVELAVALHYAFDTPTDRVVWDVGHQAYAHKILTGRRDQLSSIKQYGGLSPLSTPRRIGIRPLWRGPRLDFHLRRFGDGDCARPSQ